MRNTYTDLFWSWQVISSKLRPSHCSTLVNNW